MTFPFDPGQYVHDLVRPRSSSGLASTYREDANLLLKLTEMQATLEGSFYRALDELQRLQGIRKEREEKARAHKAKTA